MQEMSSGRIKMQYNYQNQYKNLKQEYRIQDNIWSNKIVPIALSNFIRMEMKFDESNVDISIKTNQK